MALLATIFAAVVGGVAVLLVSCGVVGWLGLAKVCVVLGLLYAALYVWSKPLPCVTPVGKVSTNLIHDQYREDKIPADLDYIVIGAGMSGLSAAGILSRLGNRVLVLEQHDRCGGGSHEFEFEGYTFDAGLHYTVPWSGPLLQLVACTKEPPVEFVKMGDEHGTFDKIKLGNEKLFDIKHGEAHKPDLYKMFPNDHAALDEYFRISNKMLFGTPIMFLSKAFPLWIQKLIWRWLLPSFEKYSGRTAVEVLDDITSNKRLQAMLQSLWIDMGATPDKTSFFLASSVFRGLPKEGGAYPRGGSQGMATSLVPVIKKYGGRVLVKADVHDILYENGAAVGVTLADATEVRAKHGVISSVGFRTTFEKLTPKDVLDEAGMSADLSIVQSPGFLMVNLGIEGNSESLNIPNCNIWCHPTTTSGDMMPPLLDFVNSKTGVHDGVQIPIMITFPSIKSQSWEKEHPNHMSCQLLTIADYKWFEEWEDEECGKRSEEYVARKEKFAEIMMKTCFEVYPQLKDKVRFKDVSTPLTIGHYIGAPKGSAVGLFPSPNRFTGDPELLAKLDVVQPLRNLYMTGQDIVCPGVVLAQLAGVMTAFRITGFFNAVKIITQNIIHAE